MASETISETLIDSNVAGAMLKKRVLILIVTLGLKRPLQRSKKVICARKKGDQTTKKGTCLTQKRHLLSKTRVNEYKTNVKQPFIEIKKNPKNVTMSQCHNNI